MRSFRLKTLALGSPLALLSTHVALAQAQLRIFTGGQQRRDVMRKTLDGYQQQNPTLKVEVEVGGATSE